MRSALLCRAIQDAGSKVIWFTGRFDHSRKEQRIGVPAVVNVDPLLQLRLLDGAGYRRNLSIARVKHQIQVARHFREAIDSMAPPQLIVASYPSPELAEQGAIYAKRFSVPFVLDIRDPWPDIFEDYIYSPLKLAIRPLLVWYRRKLEFCAKNASAICGVSDTMIDWAISYAKRSRNTLDRVFYIGYEASSAPVRC